MYSNERAMASGIGGGVGKWSPCYNNRTREKQIYLVIILAIRLNIGNDFNQMYCI